MVNFRLSRKICICLVIVLIFSNSVFAVSISSSVNAQASYTRIGQFNQYITNNYGSQSADANTSLLIGMYQSLAKLAAPGVAYGIDRVNHSYYLTGTLTYLQEYLMQITENQYDMYKSEDTYLDGLSSAVSDIKTNTTNSAASDLAALTFLGSIESMLKTDNWITASSFLGVSETYNGTYINISSTLNNVSYSDLYWHFANFNIPGQNFYKVVLPTRSSAQNRLNEYIESIDITSSNGGTINADYVLDYDYASNRVIIYILNYVPFVQAYDFIVHVKYAYSFNIFSSITPTIQYVDYNSFGYIMKSNNLYLRELLKKDSNIIINDSINSTDIDLDVTIGISDFEEVNTISNKLRTWLSTGVSVSALIAALDALDDSFFTLPNRNTIETINSQYTDFYD